RETILADQRGLSKSFFDNLLGEFQAFFVKVEANLARERQFGEQAKLGEAGEGLRKQRELQGQKKLLAGFGMTTDDQVQAANANISTVKSVIENSRKAQELPLEALRNGNRAAQLLAKTQTPFAGAFGDQRFAGNVLAATAYYGPNSDTTKNQ